VWESSLRVLGDRGLTVPPTARRPAADLHALRLQTTKYCETRVLHDLAWSDSDFRRA